MTRPSVNAATEQIYRLLPDFMRTADANNDYILLRYLAGAGVSLEKAADFLTLVDPDTSVTGTCEIVNPAAAPRSYLGWLGWLVGVDTTVLDDPDVRAAILLSPESQRRGSIAAIKNSVARTLTDSKMVRVYVNASGTDPYLISVVTLTSETVDANETLLAALMEKPAGADLEVQTVPGSTWIEVVAEYDAWTDVTTAHATWDDLITWTPTP